MNANEPTAHLIAPLAAQRQDIGETRTKLTSSDDQSTFSRAYSATATAGSDNGGVSTETAGPTSRRADTPVLAITPEASTSARSGTWVGTSDAPETTDAVEVLAPEAETPERPELTQPKPPVALARDAAATNQIVESETGADPKQSTRNEAEHPNSKPAPQKPDDPDGAGVNDLANEIEPQPKENADNLTDEMLGDVKELREVRGGEAEDRPADPPAQNRPDQAALLTAATPVPAVTQTEAASRDREMAAPEDPSGDPIAEKTTTSETRIAARGPVAENVPSASAGSVAVSGQPVASAHAIADAVSDAEAKTTSPSHAAAAGSGPAEVPFGTEVAKAGADPNQPNRVEPGPALRLVTQSAMDIVRSPGSGVIDVALSPEELGQVRLSLSAKDGGIVVVVSAERAETLDLLRRNIDSLHQDLRQAGFADIGFEFGQTGGEATSPRNRDGSDTAQDSADIQQPQDLPLPPSRPAASPGLDLRI